MARGCQGLTRPSLQLGPHGPWHYVPVAGRDCVRHTLGEICGIRASSPDYAGSMPAGPVFGCPGSLGRIAIYFAATAVGAHSGNRILRSKIDVGLEDVVERARRTRRKACSP